MFDFVMRNREGSRYTLAYNPVQHRLYHEGKAITWSECECGGDTAMPPRGLGVRLVLGKNCNFKCTYCCQRLAGKRHEPDPGDLEGLVDNIIRVAGASGLDNVQFWGGETLLYFETLKKLHKLFLERTGTQHTPPYFFVPTNGLLLNGERLDWILENKIHAMVSWDGPAQHLRGKDVLAEGPTLDAVRRIHAQQPDKISIAPILSRHSMTHKAVVDMVHKKLGTDKFNLGEGRIISVVDEHSMSAAIPREDLAGFSRRMHADLVAGELPQFGMAHDMARSWLRSLNCEALLPRPYMCHVGKADTLVVDLEGNVLTCSTFECGDVDESGEDHKLCHISQMSSMADRPVPQLRRLTSKQQGRCGNCVMLHACRGGCPYAPEAYVDYNCAASYAWSLPIVGLALHMVTGHILEEVRPQEMGE